MTPRYRTAFSVPSGFAASTPTTTSSPVKSAVMQRQPTSATRQLSKPARVEPSSDRASAAA